MSRGDEAGLYESTFKIGRLGAETFQIHRDNDKGQAIYPAKTRTETDTSVPVEGPDADGYNKKWLVKGVYGDTVKVQLRVANADVSVTLISDSFETRCYESVYKPRKTYYIAGTFNDFNLDDVMWPDEQGIFTFPVTIGPDLHEDF